MYAILYDWGSDGLQYYKREEGKIYEVATVDEAVQTALKLNYTASFEIVKRVNFKAMEA